MLSARQYQGDATAAIEAAAARGRRRVIAALATGLGKSVIAAMLIRQRGGRALLLAHRDALIRQLADKVRMVWPEVRVGVVKAQEDDYRAQVVCASVQTLAQPARLRRLLGQDGQALMFHDAPSPFATVVLDECHHAPAESYMQVLRGLGCFDDGGPLLVGFSATPERSDDKGLAEVFEEIVYEMGILDGIRQGYLCNLRGKQVQLAADFSKLHVRAGEFRDEETASMMMEANAPAHAAQAYLEHAKGRPALAFTPTVAVALAFAEAFRAAGVPAEAAHGEMPVEEQRAILHRLATGKTMVVPNAALFTEGTDAPSVSCIIVGKPTRSRPAYVQMVGRGTRLYPGKDHTLVLDLVGTATRHDLSTMATLFDVSPEAAERGIVEAVAAKEALPAPAEKPAEGRLVSVDFEMFAARAFAWVQAGVRFILSLGEWGDVVLQPSDDPSATGAGGAAWDVFRVRRTKVSAPGARFPRYQEQRQKLYAGLDLGYAQGYGEDIARKEAAILTRKDAGWRREAPSDKQRARLQAWGLWQDGLTKGQANDLIAKRYLQRAYGGGGGQQRRRA